MNTRLGFSLALVLLTACGGGEEPAVREPTAPAAEEPAAEERVEPAPEVDWSTIFHSELIAEVPPPPVASLAERAASDRERLTQILDQDMRSDRNRILTLQRRLSLRPDDTALRFELGEFYYQKELPNLAEVEFLTVLEKDEHFGVAHKLLADIYRQAGEQGRAAWHARRAHRDVPVDSTVMFLWGWTIRDGGDIETAAAIAEAGLALDPADERVLVLLAMLRADDGRYEEAIELARRGIAANPDHLRGHSVLGQCLSALGREDEAQVEMELHRRLLLLNSAKLLRREPPLSESERAAALAHYHQLVGRLDLAREELARSFELEPDNAAAHVITARIAVAEGDEIGAKEILEAVLQKTPDDPRATRALANLLAIATNLELRDPERAMNLAGSLLGRGGSGDFEVLFTLGMAEAALGYEQQARRHIKAALEVEPTNPFALEALASLEASPTE